MLQFYPCQPLQFMDGLLTPAIGARGNVDCSYVSTAQNTTSLTAYTFAALPLGEADDFRHTVIGFMGGQTAARSISALTVGGLSGSAVVFSSASNNVFSGLYIFDTKSLGTTANVVITWSGAMLRCAVASWRLVGIGSPTPVGTVNVSTGLSPLAGTLSVPRGGCAIAVTNVANTSGSGGGTSTWTGPAKRFETAIATERTWAGGDQSYEPAQSPLSVSIAWTNLPSSFGTLSAASWGPPS